MPAWANAAAAAVASAGQPCRRSRSAISQVSWLVATTCGNTQRSGATPAARAASAEHSSTAEAMSTVLLATIAFVYGNEIIRLSGDGVAIASAVCSCAIPSRWIGGGHLAEPGPQRRDPGEVIRRRFASGRAAAVVEQGVGRGGRTECLRFVHQLDGIGRQHLRVALPRPALPMRLESGLAQPLQRPRGFAPHYQRHVELAIGDALRGDAHQLLGRTAGDGGERTAGIG